MREILTSSTMVWIALTVSLLFALLLFYTHRSKKFSDALNQEYQEAKDGLKIVWFLTKLMLAAMLLFSVFLGLVIFLSNSIEAQNQPAGADKKLLVVSGMPDAHLNDLYNLIGMNEKSPIDINERPSNVLESDVIVYFLDSWEDAVQAPGATELAVVFDSLKTIGEDAVSHVVVIETASGKDIQFIFYSLESSGYLAPRCYAEDIVSQA